MREIVFVRTRHFYQSYDVYWALVELAGFRTCFVDEIDFASPTTYIVTPINGSVIYGFPEAAKDHTCELIWWALERFDGPGLVERTPKAILDEVFEELHFDRAWTSCRHVAALDPRFEYVVFGSDERLLTQHRVQSIQLGRYDYTHQSYAWGRRQTLYSELTGLGLREGPSCWEALRSEVIASSNIFINAHQYPMQVYAPLRFALAATFRKPVVTEWIDDPHPVTDCIVNAPRAQFATVVWHLARIVPEADRLKLGERLFQRLCKEHPFKASVERAQAGRS